MYVGGRRGSQEGMNVHILLSKKEWQRKAFESLYIILSEVLRTPYLPSDPTPTKYTGFYFPPDVHEHKTNAQAQKEQATSSGGMDKQGNLLQNTSTKGHCRLLCISSCSPYSYIRGLAIWSVTAQPKRQMLGIGMVAVLGSICQWSLLP